MEVVAFLQENRSKKWKSENHGVREIHNAGRATWREYKVALNFDKLLHQNTASYAPKHSKPDIIPSSYQTVHPNQLHE
jgi:hypothetical protein